VSTASSSLPPTPTDATVLIWAGGGRALGRPEEDEELARALEVATGIRTRLVTYRFGPAERFPAALTDVYLTMERALDGVGPAGPAPRRLLIGGDGIGAGLAAAAVLLACRYAAPLPAAQLLLAPLLDARLLSPSWERPEGQGARREIDAALAAYAPGLERADPLLSPLLADLPAALPPTLIVTAEHDPARDDGERYAARLRAAKLAVDGHRYEATTAAQARDGGRSEQGRRVLAGLASAVGVVLSRATE
jgi:acetyl esterase